ncbi:hypothetical protein C485_18484 [Natrinema altunense JCM 12890]|uniref:Uncharacterized protein n=1 Tax=Natrinema altunense (strain JCM 12890 / CGMCC 1.3731 / AJ2) TaxID=1227494 RepID=L9Z9T3_NATA2|nr:hypothetical protein C485_18484 [Natrinema altunense JCM 12890]
MLDPMAGPLESTAEPSVPYSTGKSGERAGRSARRRRTVPSP